MEPEENEVTDSFPVPRLAAPDEAPKVSLASGDTSCTGAVVAVHGDEIVVLVSEGLSVDAQVEIATTDAPALESIGAVIWSREEDGKTALGIEIMGGAAEWSERLEG